MVRVEWDRYPLLLFSDEQRIGPEAFEKFQKNDVSSVTKYNVQMGLPEGHSILVYYEVGWTRYQAVLVSMSSAPSRRRRNEREHAMWKHVRPVPTDFAWLSPELAHAFCSEALQLEAERTYGDF